MMTRREWILGAAAVAGSQMLKAETKRPEGVLIESHIHLFAGDPVRFPYSGAVYKPVTLPVEQYGQFAREVRLNHAVIVHPEPYQDDHRYLEYCFEHEPFPGFFKGTCLFDPIDPATPGRMRALAAKHPGKIVALRIHEVHEAGTPSTTKGPIRDRNLGDPQMEATWRAVHEQGMAVQMHMIPHYAPGVYVLAEKFRAMPVILDHLARPGQGTPQEYEQVLRLATLPRVYMKYSKTGVETISKQPFPHLDARPMVKRIYEAFGPDRMIWGELGGSKAEFAREVELFDAMFDFAAASDRQKIRGLTSQKLFAFT
jgi:predicted TIM-barrel fold metal-dependent hydrolase